VSSPSAWHWWWLAARPRTLPASLAPLVLGNGLALLDGSRGWWLAVVSLVCATSLQVMVNFANDLADGVGGVDNEDRLGPLRMVQQGRIAPRAMCRGIALCMAVAVLTGLVMAAASSWWLIVVGALCLLAALGYSSGPWPLASLGLGEVAAFVFFGPVAVAGSYFVQMGRIDDGVWLPAVAIGLPIAAIMLVNNIRDIPTDTAAGKRTLAVRLGAGRARPLYWLLMLLPALMLMTLGTWRAWLLGGLVLAAACLLCRQLQRNQGRALNALLAQTARFALLLALTWLAA